MWGFKYDSRLTGINVHADDAAVNVNFWITPDEANLDPDSGGLVVWDKARRWTGTSRNTTPTAGSDPRFPGRAGAKSVTVPYRANRAVIFNSDLFHETDKLAFKEGYLNRRINITMLFGRRERLKRYRPRRSFLRRCRRSVIAARHRSGGPRLLSQLITRRHVAEAGHLVYGWSVLRSPRPVRVLTRHGATARLALHGKNASASWPAARRSRWRLLLLLEAP